MAGGGWRQCGKEDRDGRRCPGIRADHFVKPVQFMQRARLCLAHLGPGQLDEVLSQLFPGCEIDVRGTRISGELLRKILERVVEDGTCTLRDANFTDVRFDGDVDFGNTIFRGTTRFRGATFNQGAHFERVRFEGEITDFEEAQFRRASFRWAQFNGAANFARAQFHRQVSFASARFDHHFDLHGARFLSQAVGATSVDFTDTAFMASVDFEGVWCHQRGGLDFSGASFAAADRVGPLGCNVLLLDRATFGNSVRIETLATQVSCRQTRFEAGVRFRIRYARLQLEGAVLSSASSLTGSEPGKDPSFDSFAEPRWLELDNSELANQIRSNESRPDLWMPILSSVQGVDVAELTISDVDLSQARFSGAYHLDQLSIEGRSRFAEPQSSGRWRGPLRIRWAWPPIWVWTRRQLLAEEAAWRAEQRGGTVWAPFAAEASETVTPEALAAMYRSLRKAQEDNKNVPGASDFYYGEMEMRRHAASTTLGERAILSLYWLTSGYGLRGMRALGCLILTVALVTPVMAAFGFADTQVSYGTTAVYVAQAAFSLQAGSSGTQELTWQGELVRIVMRLVGPMLVGLLLLSVRNRVKR